MTGILGGLIGSLRAAIRNLTTWSTVNVSSFNYMAATYTGTTFSASHQYLAVATDTPTTTNATTVFHSSNGLSFSSYSFPFAIGARALASSGSTVVAASGQGSATTTDGASWTSTGLIGSGITTEAIWDGERFIVATINTNQINYSPTGASGSWISFSVGPGISPNAIGFNGSNQYIIVGNSTNPTNSYAYCTGSPEVAGNWIQSTLPSSAVWTSAKSNGSIWIVSTGGSSTYLTSTNGLTWTSRISEKSMNAGTASGVRPKIAVYGGKFYHINSTGQDVYESANGIDWTSVYSNSFLNNMLGFAAGPDRLILVGKTGTGTGDANTMVLGVA